MSLVRFRPEAPDAGVAHPVERHLAKVEVASSSLVIRSILKALANAGAFLLLYFLLYRREDANDRIIAKIIRKGLPQG